MILAIVLKQGNGYATEAAQHILYYRLNELNLNEIFGKTYIVNIASENLLKKIEMIYLKEITKDAAQVRVYVCKKSL